MGQWATYPDEPRVNWPLLCRLSSQRPIMVFCSIATVLTRDAGASRTAGTGRASIDCKGVRFVDIGYRPPEPVCSM
jgi:hypothetical protein